MSPGRDRPVDPPADLHVPEGDLIRSRVVVDIGETLEAALSRGLTGYAVVEPGGSLLRNEAGAGVLTFADGVPVLAYCEATDRGGVDALADLATPGPCAVDLYTLPASALTDAHDAGPFRVPPGAPAEELAANPELADRTRERAPAEREDAGGATAVESFLADEERIAAIQEEAKAEAEQRAEEWGLTDELE